MPRGNTWFRGWWGEALFYFTLKENWSHFDLKCWVTGETKTRPRFPDTILRVWLSISSLFNSNILQLFWIPGRILVPPVTQLFRSKWLDFFFQCIACIFITALLSWLVYNISPQQSWGCVSSRVYWLASGEPFWFIYQSLLECECNSKVFVC